MANQNLNTIFLSASIPYPDRDKQYYDSADTVAIRDSVRALATVVIPKAHLVWAGHPSITPLIRFVMGKMNANLKTHITLYQSLYFEDEFPKDNFVFENIVLVERKNTREESLQLMRNRLMGDYNFKAGIFIGGMEGVAVEYELFREIHPKAKLLPFASTGAAAKIIFDSNPEKFDHRLADNYAYMSIFKDLLSDIL